MRNFLLSSTRAGIALLALLALNFPTVATAAPADRTKASAPTALDRYVAAPDTNYHWEVVNTFKQPGISVHVIALTSQQWLTSKEVNKPLWKHYLTVAVPEKTTNQTALLVISGGSNDKAAPSKADSTISMIAMT